MKILLTGGCGFIGSNLARHLVRECGAEVVNFDKLTYAGNPRSLADLDGDPGYAFVQGDLCDAPAVEKALREHRPHAIMHLAAESHVDRSIDGPGDFIQTNIVGTYHLLQAALGYWRSLPEKAESEKLKAEKGVNVSMFPLCKKSFRFLHVSTDEVYGSLRPDDPAFSETTPYDPHSPYSASKAASDHLARAWGDTYGLPVLVTNCSNNYGPFQFPEKLIPVVILKCLRGEAIPVYGKGENIRDWLYVGDHAEALHAVLARGRVGETYNIGGNNERRNIDLVRLISRLMDAFTNDPAYAPRIAAYRKHLQSSGRTQNHSTPESHEDLITFVADRPGHDMRYAIDSTKIKRELGWEPRESADSGLRKTVQWYLDNPTWWQAILDGDYPLQRLGQSAR